eukprot:m.163489 g.163489  ORF g.163489 m.163489 type:complete len:381 (+) comp18103_c0_seq7:142-1284(+)
MSAVMSSMSRFRSTPMRLLINTLPKHLQGLHVQQHKSHTVKSLCTSTDATPWTFATPMTEMLGIKYPIMMGGMHYVGYAELAAAVSEAGGLGVITALTQENPEALRQEIRKCRDLTSKPFGVNLTLLPSLKPLDYPGYVRAIVEEDVKIVETAGRSPKDLVPLFKEHGITTIHKCVAIRHALSAERLGVDIISIDGFECAGHPGEEDIGNWILAAKAGKVLNAPFIVSGGNGLGSQLAASLAFGASGINMGTRFMVTKECAIHPNIKKAIMAGDETATTLIMRSLNNTERVFDNEQAQTVRRIEASTPGDFSSISQLVQGALYHKSFHETGNVQDSVWSCGTVMGLIDDEPTCAELVTRIMDECRQAIAQLPVATKNTPP